MSQDMIAAFWTVGVAIVASLMCAWLGVWLVLQRVSMLGDAISHSVLPGLVGTFLLFGTRASLPMFLGAVVAGLLTVLLTRAISKASLLREDAAMGVVFTVLFALGVTLIHRYARQIDLDPGCVLYGLIEFVSLDTVPVAGVEVPRAMFTLIPALLVTTAFLLLFRKELALMAFDSPLAKALGFRPNGLYYALMVMVAVATVASFEAVGSILVIAMLIGPAATAQLLTRKLRSMFWISGICAVLASVFGYMLAVRLNTSVAGMMSVVIGALYTGAVVFSPAGGVLHKSIERAKRRALIAREDILAAAYRLRETGSAATASAMRDLIGAAWFQPSAIDKLKSSGLLLESNGAFELTQTGTGAAAGLVRRHRLLEAFFVEQMQKGISDVHEEAHLAEHFLSKQGERDVQEVLGERDVDPHGKSIPKA